MEMVVERCYSENTATSASFIVAILMLCQPAVLSRVSTRYVLNCDRNSALPITAIPIECTAALDLTAQHNLSAKSAISISSCIYYSCACVRVFYVTHAVKSYRNLCQKSFGKYYVCCTQHVGKTNLCPARQFQYYCCQLHRILTCRCHTHGGCCRICHCG